MFRKFEEGSRENPACDQARMESVEGHAMSDHVHLCLSIPPKFSVAHTVGFLKGKSAIRIPGNIWGRRGISRDFISGHVVSASARWD